MGALDTLTNLGTGFASDFLSSATQAYFNKKSQARDQGFIREQLQNKHQWEVDDLKKAGLNPILSATAGIGHGGATSSGTPSVGKGDIANSARASKLMNAEHDKVKAETNSATAAAYNQTAQGEYYDAMSAKVGVDTTRESLRLAGEHNKHNVETSEFGKLMAYVEKSGVGIGSILTAGGVVMAALPLAKKLAKLFGKKKALELNPFPAKSKNSKTYLDEIRKILR